MSRVLPFPDKTDEENSLCLHGPMKCFHCKHEWTGFAEDYDFNECPNCGLFKGVLTGNMLKKDQKHFICNCGCDIYRIPQDGYIYCVNCGHDVVFDD